MAHTKADLPTIHDPYNDEVRVLGSLPSDPRLVASLPPYSGEVLPESELREFDDFPADVIKIKDQDGAGACNGFATAMALQMARFVQGMDHVELSGWYVYGRLVHGRDTGSNILQAYDLVGTEGCSPEEYVPYGEFNDRRFSAEAKAAAPRFRLEFGEKLTTFRQMVSHVMLGGCLNYSLHVGNNFNNLDEDDVPGISRGPGNHAVAGGLSLKKSKKWGWMPGGINSWRDTWGNRGRFRFCEKMIEAGSYFECFTVKAVVDDPLDPENPPVAPVLANLPKRTTWRPPDLVA